MHAKMMIALAKEVERNSASERQRVQVRSLALANRAQALDGSHAAGGFARRLLVGISLRPRLS